MMLKSMLLFGKEIQIKKTDCNLLNEPGSAIEPYVNVFVKVTKGCNANCPFCSNAGSKAQDKPFNVDKLAVILREIQSKQIFINRVNITGGEPSVVPFVVEDILSLMERPEFKGIHMHLNTNGLLPESKRMMCHPRWDSISMSLHHYSISKLSELYGCTLSQSAFDFEGVDMSILNASCNLVKDYIDSPGEAAKMLDFAIDLGIPRIGFVALMKINDYCKEHFIDLEDIHLETIPHVYFTRSMNRGKDCKCSNYLYNKNLKVLEIYMRNYSNPYYCESSLVYDGEYLRQGFYKDNIIY